MPGFEISPRDDDSSSTKGTSSPRSSRPSVTDDPMEAGNWGRLFGALALDGLILVVCFGGGIWLSAQFGDAMKLGRFMRIALALVAITVGLGVFGVFQHYVRPWQENLFKALLMERRGYTELGEYARAQLLMTVLVGVLILVVAWGRWLG